jgi:hypothetical protein
MFKTIMPPERLPVPTISIKPPLRGFEGSKGWFKQTLPLEDSLYKRFVGEFLLYKHALGD